MWLWETWIQNFYPGEGDLTHHPWLVTKVVNGFQWVDAGKACILHANDQVTEVLILRHAERMLPDEHKVWPEGSGKKVEASVPLTSTSGHTYISLSPISKAQDRERSLGATWFKSFILLLFLYELEMRYNGTSQRRFEKQISEMPLFL